MSEHPVRNLRLETFRWVVGSYSFLLGAMLFVAPHRIAAVIAGSVSVLGAAFMISGVGLLAAAALHLSRAALVAAHLVAATTFLAMADQMLQATGPAPGTVNHGLWCLANLLAAFVTATRRGAREHRPADALTSDLFIWSVAAFCFANGAALLLLSDRFRGAAIQVRASAGWNGAGFLGAALALLAAQLSPGAPRLARALLHGLAACVLFVYMMPFVPQVPWSGFLSYGGFGLTLILLPWVWPSLSRIELSSIRSRLAMILALVSVVPLIATAALISLREERLQISQALETQRKVAGVLALEVAAYARLHRSIAVASAAQIDPARFDPDEMRVRLARIREANSDVFALTVVDEFGTIFASSVETPPIYYPAHPLFEELRRADRPLVRAVMGAGVEQPFLVAGAPVRYTDGRFGGIVLCSIESRSLAELLNAPSGESGGDNYLVDEQGRIISHRDLSRVALDVGRPADSEAVAALLRLKEGAGAMRVAAREGDRLAGFARIPELGWGLVTELPESQALAGLVEQRNRTFSLLLGAIALAIVVGIVAAGALVRPLAALAGAAEQMASGNSTAPLGRSSVLELHNLAVTFDSMRRALALRTGEQERAEAELRKAHHELEDRVRERTSDLQLANARLEIEVRERKQAEEERERLLARELEARRQAEAANRTKDDFLAVVSHELRTPLTPMLGWTRLLRQRQLDAAGTSRALDSIERAVRVEIQLVNDLLDISRITSGKLRLETKAVDLDAVVRSAIETIRPAAEAREITLDLTSRSGLEVSGDFDRLQQVVWNLLSNAVKFTPHGGQVDVCLAAAGADAELAVRDNGKGIPPDLLPHVFEPFRQGDGSNSRTHGGLGLGLAIVRRMVELHGGVVLAESAGEDKGSIFVVRLPRLVARRPVDAPDPGSSGRIRIVPSQSAAAEEPERARQATE